MASKPVAVKILVQPIGVKAEFSPGILFDIIERPADDLELLGFVLARSCGANYIPAADGDSVLIVATSGSVSFVQEKIGETLRSLGYDAIFE